ncbi:MAG: hypothetical protein WC796_03245 [Candidatus Pacearchaeota archaeon]|jgi:hypothetical protein
MKNQLRAADVEGRISGRFPLGSLSPDRVDAEFERILAEAVTVEPGTFHDTEELELARDPEARRRVEEERYSKARPLYARDLIGAYELFRERVYSPKRVLYPGCDLDASPVRAFPRAKVDLVDINALAIGALNRNGVNAIHSDIRQYKPEQLYDLLILLNPGVSSDKTTCFLDSKGYVLANDWHRNASQLVEDKSFKPLGTIVFKPKRVGPNKFDREPNLKLGEVIGLGEVADNFWIFRRK